MSEGTEPRLTKDELLERIRAKRKELALTIVELDEAELEAFNEDGWTVKDQLAHLATWERGIAFLLQKRPRYAGMGLDKATWRDLTMDEINAIIHRHYQDADLEDVLAYYQEAHDELKAAINALDEEELYQPYAYFQPDEPGQDSGRPIIDWIIGNTFDHYEGHLEIIRNSKI